MPEIYADSIEAKVDGTNQIVPIRDITKAPAIIASASGESIQLSDSGDAPLSDIHLFGKSKQVTTTGAQLIPCPIDEELESQDGFVAVISKDNGIEVTLKTGFTPISSASDIYFAGEYQVNEESAYELQPQIPAGQYHLHIDDETFNSFLFYIIVWRNGASNALSSGTTQDIDITIQENDKFKIFIRPKNGATTGTYTIKPVLNSGSTALPWEPYTGGKPSPSPDYPQEINIPGSGGSIGIETTGAQLINYPKGVVSATLPTPNGLPGIPVTSGGNYTDADGQQWVCDEIDYGLNKYVQNIGIRTVDNDTVIRQSGVTNDYGINNFIFVEDVNGKNILCNLLPRQMTFFSDTQTEGILSATGSVYIRLKNDNFPNAESVKAWAVSNNLKYMFIKENPVITQLQNEELEAYKALMTYYPNTNINTDTEPQVGMEVKYTADTKTWIENKLTEIQTQILNMQA